MLNPLENEEERRAEKSKILLLIKLHILNVRK